MYKTTIRLKRNILIKLKNKYRVGPNRAFRAGPGFKRLTLALPYFKEARAGRAEKRAGPGFGPRG